MLRLIGASGSKPRKLAQGARNVRRAGEMVMRLAGLYRTLTPWRQVAEGVQRVGTNHEGKHFLCRRQSCQELPDNNCKFGQFCGLTRPCQWAMKGALCLILLLNSWLSMQSGLTKNQDTELFIDINVIASDKVTP